MANKDYHIHQLAICLHLRMYVILFPGPISVFQLFTVVFLSRDVELLVLAFKVYVRPLLEHNSVIWSPNTVQDIDAIECVQRRFTKRLRGLHDYSYEARLKYLDLQSLELCRLLVDLILCYKIVFGLVDVDVNEFLS